MATANLTIPAPRELAERSIHLDPALVPQIIWEQFSPAFQANMDRHLLDAAQIATVQDATDYQLALDVASLLRGDAKTVEETCEPLCGALHKMHKAATTFRGELQERPLAESSRLASIAQGWKTKEERRLAEEAARIQREADETARREREARDKEAQEEAAKLEKAGNHEQADRVIEDRIQERTAEAMAPVSQVLPRSALPAGVSTPSVGRVDWGFEVVDKRAFVEAALSNTFIMSLLLLDESTLSKLAKTQKTAFSFPGLKVTHTEKLAIKAKQEEHAPTVPAQAPVVLADFDWQSPAADSKQIDAMAWDGDRNRMLVRFKGKGSVYAYPNASRHEMISLLSTGLSDGLAFNAWKETASARGYERLN